MNSRKIDVDACEAQRLEDSKPSFHGQLLRSAITTLPDRRKRRPPLKKRTWTGWPVVLGRFVGQGAIFAGGLAIGGGVMMFRKGEALRGRPGILLVAGVALVLLSIASRLFAKGLPKSEASAARG